MIQNRLVQLLLLPITLLYGLGVGIRDFLYKQGMLKGGEFDVPIIAVGNLSVGGAGKSPHIEYLIRFLKEYLNVATISRGYKRKTKGYLTVQARNTAEQVGDEPLQFKRKFPDIFVTVAESRTFAVPRIVMQNPEVQVILLDDAFQHRSIKPGLNILLTEFHHPFTQDYLLPSGRLREWRSAYKRADIIIVSKCPSQITEEDRARFKEEIKPLSYQQLFFSYYQYQRPFYMFNRQYVVNFEDDIEVLLICAIARTEYLTDYLNSQVGHVQIMEYEDHHYFTEYDLGQLKKHFNLMEGQKKIIVTTEKDAMRLELHRKLILENKLRMFVLPIGVVFHFEEGEQFQEEVKEFLLDFKV
jgi:tetraacyldisaccharide 4'-kinase